MQPPRRGNRAARRAAQRREQRPTQRRRPPGYPSGRSVALAALTSSAMSLPGIPGSASAESTVEGPTLTYQGSFYIEDEIKGSKTVSGESEERYEIWAHQVNFRTPFTRRSDIAIDLVRETMSGASPWFVERGANGDPVQVMSGATIEEERTDVQLRYNYYLDNGGFSVLGGISNERDYFAGSAGLELKFDFNENNTSVTTGGGFSFDSLEPTDAGQFVTRPSKERKQSYNTFLSVTQVLTRSIVAQASVTYQLQRGYLSDPYKLISVGSTNIGDSRPEERNQLDVAARYRQHIGKLGGSLHADYHFYYDDWGMYAHTVELGWHQTLFDFIRLIPSARYYTQTQADFYAPYFVGVPSDKLGSSDYRLSPYGAVSWKIKAEFDLPRWPFGLDWMAALSWERYLSDADFSLKKVDTENPGLVSFSVFSVQLKTKF